MTSKDYTQFPIVPANKKTLSRRRRVNGGFVNDADYQISHTVNGKSIWCPYYNVWKSMVNRCYSKVEKKNNASYVDCSVAPEWNSFMNFRSWMKDQDWEGKQIDKDIMIPGNKVYGPQACVFVTREINQLLTDRRSKRGKYPQGVSYNKYTREYLARMKRNGKSKHLGTFATPEEASATYREAKRLHILTIACCEPDIRVNRGL